MMKQGQIRPVLFTLVIAGLIISVMVTTARAQTGDQVTTTALQTGPGFTFQGQYGITVRPSTAAAAAVLQAPITMV